MADAERRDVMERMRAALDLYEVGEAIMRQNLRRRFPGASEERIEELIGEWLLRRPGAEHGDAAGPPGPLPIKP